MFTEKILLPLLRKVLKLEPSKAVRPRIPRKPIQDSSVIVVGAIRNGEGKIGPEIRTLRHAMREFKKVSFLVVESDSSDRTVEELEGLKAEIPDFDFVSLGELRSHMPLRTQRLAHCRNYYVDQIAHNEKYAGIDYVAAADIDGLNTSLSAEAVRSCWEADEDWDVITANQRGLYYDIWALRHPLWCPDDCWKQYAGLRELIGHEQAQELAVLSRIVHLDSEVGLIEVDAAFGGFAIYKRQAFISGRYMGLDESGNEICDNIPFHADLKKKGFRIFINAALINAEETEHTAYKRERAALLASAAAVSATTSDSQET